MLSSQMSIFAGRRPTYRKSPEEVGEELGKELAEAFISRAEEYVKKNGIDQKIRDIFDRAFQREVKKRLKAAKK